MTDPKLDPHRIVTTTALPFGSPNIDTPDPFSVNPGIPLKDALTHIAHLLACGHASALEMCDTPMADRGLLWSTINSIEAARALTDSLLV
ncbi:DUF3077 domain-containing protein [Pseudomonas sp. HR96]|uniref:DUF3077 domain-containing protein n=1 Tax=Pseudomonas sp. HR96 TaxID=1027966 RepID=UPI002A75DC20|nr:DUF3077 domain-containing protein [Pseudomonas sp. HR96]WPP02007.1 DUF3077 domain-containing protein [Pseudomonas sp. HR96]